MTLDAAALAGFDPQLWIRGSLRPHRARTGARNAHISRTRRRIGFEVAQTLPGLDVCEEETLPASRSVADDDPLSWIVLDDDLAHEWDASNLVLRRTRSTRHGRRPPR
jgi:hypothetical protein